MKNIVEKLIKIANEKQMRQELVWMPESTVKPRMNCSVPFLGNKRPNRLWTLYEYMYKNNPPTLPFEPKHNKNAFLEYYMNDWIIENGKLRYFS